MNSTRRTFIEQLIKAGLVTLLAPSFAQAEAGKRVVLDAGHGMGNRRRDLYDPGAVVGDVQEADLVLKYALETGKLLQGYKVDYTRKDAVTNISLDGRAQIANDCGADLFVSIHCNASPSKNARGVIVYHYPGSEKGEKAAEVICDSLVAKLKSKVPDIKGKTLGERYRVLEKTKGPAVLIETGFLTNDEDRNYLVNHSNLISQGISDGIASYLI